MFTRRLLVIFFMFGFVGILIIGRLAQIQLIEVDKWKVQAETFINRHIPLETSRGTIYDRQGRILAQDVPCYDVAIDYRAMNMDDRWIANLARQNLRDRYPNDKQLRIRLMPGEKERIAELIDDIPDKLAQVTNLPKETIMSNYETIRSRMDALKQSLWTSSRFDKNTSAQSEIDSLIDPDRKIDLKETRSAHTIIPAIADMDAFRLKKELDNYPGLIVQDAKRRVYPYGAVGAHIIGMMRRVNKDEYEKKLPHFDRGSSYDDAPGNLRGYLPGDDIGAMGAELMAEERLRGTRGLRTVLVGSGDQDAKREEAIQGQNVTLTIDIELQKNLTNAYLDPKRNLLKGQDGEDHQIAVVIMSVDGQILAMISTPTYDLNTARDPVKYTELLRNEADKPLLNRVVASVYPPGSTVKPLVAAAALSEKLTNSQDTITCNGYYFRGMPNAYRCSAYTESHTTHGPLRLDEALERSCNIYFYTLGDRLGLERISRWFSEFGLGATTGIGMVEEVKGSLPSIVQSRDADTLRRESIFLGIGQGPISATPLQMANAYATLLRGGVYIQPRIFVNDQSKMERKFTLTPEVVATIRHGMDLVVAGDHGTARRHLKMNISIAGKTGSADARRRAYTADGKPAVDTSGKPLYREDADAWFVGYVPADRPKFIIAAVKEFGGHGGTSATPLVKEAVLELERQGYLPKLD